MKAVLARLKAILTLAPVRQFLTKEKAPIRKVLAGGIAAAVVFLAHCLGLHIPVKTIDDLALSFAGIVVAYIAKP